MNKGTEMHWLCGQFCLDYCESTATNDRFGSRIDRRAGMFEAALILAEKPHWEER